jgi:hypothetical protein
MMHNVEYSAIAVRNVCRACKDFERVVRFFYTLCASDRIKLSLAGMLITSY